MTDAEGSVIDGSRKSQGDIDLCIICRCDDTDGEHYSPLGYLGYVQRSRQCQIRSSVDNLSRRSELYEHYVVVNERGCQVRVNISFPIRLSYALPDTIVFLTFYFTCL